MDSQDVACIIQARTSSTRLPGKIFAKLDETKTVLDYVIDQLSYSKLLGKLVIATTQDNDSEVVEFATNRGVDYFCGSATDVLDRYCQCAKKLSIKNIVRVTSDCPLVDPKTVDKVIEKFLSDDFDYVTNKLPIESPTCNQGAEVEVFSFETLQKIWNKSKKISEREHVTPYIYNHPDEFKIFNIPNTSSGLLRYTIDREKDLELVRIIISKIKNRPILTKDIESLYSQEPEMFNLNSEYIRNEGYLKSINEEKN